ncbi:MAG: Hsp20/alpha crystallin family protein [Acidovorax sp.]
MFFTPYARRHPFANACAVRPTDLALQRFLWNAIDSAAERATGVQVQQDEKSVTLQLDVPGLTREQLQIDLDGKTVRLQTVEGAPRPLRRAWELASEIDAAASSAKLENGVLTLTLAKRVPDAAATRLDIQ